MTGTIVAWFALGTFGALALSAQELKRGPYIQLLTPDSVVIRWRTDQPATNIVNYGVEASNLVSTAYARGQLSEHVVQLTGLQPGRKYYYSVGTSGKALAGGTGDCFFVTPSKPGPAQAIRVWVVGDSGTRNANQAAVRDAYLTFTGDTRTDAMLMLGDNAYDFGTDKEYQGAVFEMYSAIIRQVPLWPTLGNHDARSCNSATQTGVYFDLFTLPRQAEAGGVASGTEAYYSFDLANAHFICLDSADSDLTGRGRMMKWLKQDLAQNRATFAFAYFHHPPYTKGSHNSDASDVESGGRLIEMRENIIPVLEAGGVDVVLSGHSHSYERSFLMDGHYGKSATFNDSFKKSAGDGRVDGQGPYRKSLAGPAPHSGTVYVVAGSSGKISGGKLNHPAMLISTNELGSLILDINTNRLDVSFLTSKGVVKDHFTMIKGAE
jgi:3',5'-cyclic AMP phosphodiesterase CpdA